MIIQCRHCQKKYKIDPAKSPQESLRIKCKNCGETLTVDLRSTLSPTEEIPKDTNTSIIFNETITPSEGGLNRPPETKGIGDIEPGLNTSNETIGKMLTNKIIPKPIKPRRVGLRLKMMILFFVIPIGSMILASAIYMWQLNFLAYKISADSYNIVERLSHQMVNDKARMVAEQCRLYLNANPQLFPEQLNKDPLFRNLALQTVGLTGYTCIYSSPDNSGKSSVWVHPNEKIIGVDLPPTMQKSMGPQYEEWFKIYRGAYNGNASSGYYKWLEKDGSIKDKYMTCYPLEGTSYILAATTYVDEIVREVKQLKTTGDLMTAKTFKLIGAVFIITCCVMGGAVLIYGRRLRSNLTQLTDAAERISIGELNTLITIKSHDEISDLADSISRMQESIRLSIERLRRKR